MNIIIVTGAAGGIGKEFIRQLKNEKGIDEIWAIGRTLSKLEALTEEFGKKVVPVPLDVTNDDELIAFQNTLKEKQPNIKWLRRTSRCPACSRPSARTASATWPCAISASRTCTRATTF